VNTEANKALVQRFVEQVFEKLRPGAVDELVADDFVSHTYPASKDGKAYLREAAERMAKALTNIRFVVNDMVAEGDRVAVRLTASATATGDFMGIPAAGKSYEIGEMHLFRLRDGKIVEHWHQYDAAGMMRQLGAKQPG
jgi:steroid delta-isomerase-like uncharacterized protein